MHNFQVVTMGLPATSGEWFRAANAPESELPALTEKQKLNARAFHRTEQDYSRGNLLLRKYAREREEREGRLLGGHVVELLAELGKDYQLHTVARRGADPGWHLLVEHQGEQVWDLYYGPEVIEEVADPKRLMGFREQFFRGLGRPDALQVAS